MEILLAIVLIVSLATLVAVAAVFVITVLPLYESKNIDIKLPQVPTLNKGAKDEITPDDVYSDTSPLEDFTPDFSKPIKIVMTGLDGNKMVVDGQQLHPVATDDILEPLDEEEQMREDLNGKN